MAAADAPLIAIVGPTASGKSALALRIAVERRGEIVSCDSLQVYEGLDIASAKPTADERRAARHHLIDVASPRDAFSAADYARLARAALRDVSARGALPIVVGGTGLYLRALLVGLFAGPSRDELLRRRLERLADRFGDARLHRVLARVDAAAAARIHPRDRVRIVRALEVFAGTGRPISSQQSESASPLEGFEVGLFGLAPARAVLRRSVEERTRAMFARGLLDEVRGLLASGFAADLRPLQAIGYRQALAVVRGEMTAAEAEREMVTETMRYAKRQMTWFRHQQPGISWFDDPEIARAAILQWLDSHGGRDEPRR